VSERLTPALRDTSSSGHANRGVPHLPDGRRGGASCSPPIAPRIRRQNETLIARWARHRREELVRSTEVRIDLIAVVQRHAIVSAGDAASSTPTAATLPRR
jgi:hypothetical protein